MSASHDEQEESSNTADNISANEETQCTICLEPIHVDYHNNEINQGKTEAESSVYRSRCGHITHTECLHRSIRSGNYNCPICRQPLGDISKELATIEKRLHRYVKMLKSGLASAAVRQRMVVDNVPVAMIDAFFTGGASRALLSDEDPPNTENSPSQVEIVERMTDKYRKMLDMGMPEGAVRQKISTAADMNENEKLLVLANLF